MDVSEIIAAGGGPTQLGKAVGVDHSTVIGWRRAGRIPAERVAAVSRATGVARHMIRADLYEAPSSADVRTEAA
jgi:DNA-binding transcriptional regulator YdaS (Cro superfamily)